MDNLSHAALAIATLQSLPSPRLRKHAVAAGTLASFFPDLDVLLKSSVDPFYSLVMHRHFTHSLIFIPVGALMCVLLLMIGKRFRSDPAGLYASCLVAYATHPILDMATAYGTQFFWPFSDVRLSWDWIAIVDLAFLVPLVIACVMASRRKSLKSARMGVTWACLYLAFGAFQHSRAVAAQAAIAHGRGHTLGKGRAMPTMSNLLVWRSVYAYDGHLYADQIRTPFLRPAQFKAGGSALQARELPAALLQNPEAERAFKIFSWFTDGFLAIQEGDASTYRYGDARYTSSTEKFDPLWGLEIDSNNPPAVRFARSRVARKAALARIWNSLWDESGEEVVSQ